MQKYLIEIVEVDSANSTVKLIKSGKVVKYTTVKTADRLKALKLLGL